MRCSPCCAAQSRGTASAWIVTMFKPDRTCWRTRTVTPQKRDRENPSQTAQKKLWGVYMACRNRTRPVFGTRRAEEKSVSVCPSGSESLKLTQLTLSGPKKINPGFLLLFLYRISDYRAAISWTVGRGCLLGRFGRFRRLKYSPSTRFLPSPTARSEAAPSVLGGTKMATQRLGWIRLRSRTTPRLRRQSFSHELLLQPSFLMMH